MPFFVKPTQDDCPLTGWWGSYAGHKGLDYGFLKADPARTQQVYAAYAGTVVSVYGGGDYNGGWGNRIIVEHAPGVRTTYNHLKTGTILVSQGQHVTTGQKLATMGATGKVTGVHLHWELYLNGERVDPRPYREGKAIPGVSEPSSGVSGNQRQVLSSGEARRRAEPTTKSASKDFPLAAGEVGSFDGWTHGEYVSGNDIWFRGLYSGDWFWSGGFVGGANTSGLTEIKIAVPPASNQRVVGSAAVSRRTGPGTTYEKKDPSLSPGDTGTFVGWAKGELVTIGGIASDTWFKGTSGDFFAAAGFTSQSTDGLTQVTVDTPPPTLPTNVLDTAYKSFTKDSQLAKWVGSPNYNYRTARPTGSVPTHITMHWMSGTLAGTDSQFQKYTNIVDGRGDGSASNYGVGQTEIHQYVRERDYQQADGNTNSNRWGISIEHEASATNPVSEPVKSLSAKLLVDIAVRYGWKKYVVYPGDVTAFRAMSAEAQLKVVQDFAQANPTQRLVFPHKAWVSTDCPGTLPFADIVGLANSILTPIVKPDPEPTPDMVSVPRANLVQMRDYLNSLLGES